MAQKKEIGEITRTQYEIQGIEWSIPNYFTLADDESYSYYSSSTFSVKNVLWHLRLWANTEQLYLYLACEEYKENSDRFLANGASREYSFEYDFGLKKCNNSVEHLLNGIMNRNEAKNSVGKYITKTQLLNRKSELVPGNVLTIVCTMKLVTDVSDSTQVTTVLDKTKPVKLIRLDILSDNFKEFFGDKESCDVILKVKDKDFKAHRSVLMARSKVLAANFKHDTLENQTSVITITDCDRDSFQEFLDYLYSGKLEALSYHSALNLYYTSNKYDVQELKAFCVEYLMQSLSVENFCEIAVFADQYDEAELFKVVQEFFNKSSLEIFLISEWEDLMKKDYRLASKLLSQMSKTKLKK